MNFSTIIKNSLLVIKINKCAQFGPPNSYSRQPTKSLLKFANTTNIPISIEKENTTLQAPPGNGKESSKSIKVKEKVILVGDSIVSGVNGKGLSTENLRPLFAIFLVQRQMIWSITQFHLQRKTLKN